MQLFQVSTHMPDHPTHARRSRIAIAVCLTGAATAFGAGFYLADRTGQSQVNLVTAGVFILCGATAMLIAILRAYLCICPSCKSWLFKQRKRDSDYESRKFPCEKCAVVWDSKVVLHLGSD